MHACVFEAVPQLNIGGSRTGTNPSDSGNTVVLTVIELGKREGVAGNRFC